MTLSLNKTFPPSHLLLLAVVLLISACKFNGLPEYWACSGQNLQIIQNKQGDVLERYIGNQKMMLEIYNHSVSQFSSSAVFGKYEVCSQTENLILFEFPQCRFHMNESLNQPSYRRWGLLDVQNGILAFGDERNLENIQIRSGGSFDCRYLGNTYSYRDMLLEND